MKFYPLDEFSRGFVNPTDIRISDFPKEVETAWQFAREKNSNLFDGTVFNFDGVVEGSIRIQRIDYSIFYVKNLYPELLKDFEISVLAISGITVIGDKILFGRRSNRVSQFRRKWEMVPSGTLEDVPGLNFSLKQSAVRQLRSEFQEETSLESSCLKNIMLFGLLVDPRAHTADLILSAEIQPSYFQESQKIKKLTTSEYSSFKLVSLRYLGLFSSTHLNMVPTSRFLLRFLKSSLERIFLHLL